MNKELLEAYFDLVDFWESTISKYKFDKESKTKLLKSCLTYILMTINIGEK